MNKIRDAFKGGKAFIPFITCGDPDLETTARLIQALDKSGADIIELGIPFSDPVAEGPVIQQANIRALSAGVTTDKIFDMLRNLGGEIKAPLVFMTYANVVFSYGTARFLKTCSEIGISALILPDVPFEEKDDFAPVCTSCGINLISLIAPTSEERVSMIAREAKGFLYCVSSLGVTGTRSEITSDVANMVKMAKKANPTISCAIGFGISTPKQAKEMAECSDGVIVGSAIVKIIAQHRKNSITYVEEFVKDMKDKIRTVNA